MRIDAPMHRVTLAVALAVALVCPTQQAAAAPGIHARMGASASPPADDADQDSGDSTAEPAEQGEQSTGKKARSGSKSGKGKRTSTARAATKSNDPAQTGSERG